MRSRKKAGGQTRKGDSDTPNREDSSSPGRKAEKYKYSDLGIVLIYAASLGQYGKWARCVPTPRHQTPASNSPVLPPTTPGPTTAARLHSADPWARSRPADAPQKRTSN